MSISPSASFWTLPELLIGELEELLGRQCAAVAAASESNERFELDFGGCSRARVAAELPAAGVPIRCAAARCPRGCRRRPMAPSHGEARDEHHDGKRHEQHDVGVQHVLSVLHTWSRLILLGAAVDIREGVSGRLWHTLLRHRPGKRRSRRSAVVCPALAAAPGFGEAVGERVARLARVRHAMYARVRRVDRSSDESLLLLSDRVEGWRLGTSSRSWSASAPPRRQRGAGAASSAHSGRGAVLAPPARCHDRHDRSGALDL